MSLLDELMQDLSDVEEEKVTSPLPSAVDQDTPLPPPHLEANEIARLVTNAQFRQTLSRVERALQTPPSPTPDDKTSALVMEASDLATRINDDMVTVYQFVRDHYRPAFPGLEGLVTHPLEYIRTVQVLAQAPDWSKVDLKAILPSALVMVVNVSATTNQGKPLNVEDLAQVLAACDVGLQLDTARATLTQYIESRMASIAPNLSTVVDTTTAAKLVSVTGGLVAFSKLPASTVVVLGVHKQMGTGMSNVPAHKRAGIVYNSPLVQSMPLSLRVKASRIISAKCCLAARVDVGGRYPDGSMGHTMREDIERKLDKLKEPPPSSKVKPLPAPLELPKKRRGGQRARRQKEARAMSELRKQQNRLVFGEAEQEADYLGEETIGLGMAGRQSGKVRTVVADQRIKASVSKKYRHIHAIAASSSTSVPGASTGSAASGFSTSLAFTPVQGLELHNPAANRKKTLRELSDKYFSGARQILDKKSQS
ncbi:U4/U6-U5 snRNP complex subunit prp31 [Dispira simplex]|nr:U4/U6-U5 snRNP complex subunit prp31 [Dispira simplex]